MFRSMAVALARILQSSSSRHRPWQVALAVALGACTGLMTSSTFLAAGMLLLLVCLPIHLPLALVVAAVIASVNALLAPAVGQLGAYSLQQPDVLSWVLRMNEFPLVPWLRINNTVVWGAIVLGAGQLLPTFLICLPLARGLCGDVSWTSQAASELLRDQDPDWRQVPIPSVSYVSIDWDDSTVSEPSSEVALLGSSKCKPASATSTPQDSETGSTSGGTSTANTSAVQARMESFLANRPNAEEMEAKTVADRASELAELVDEMLGALQDEEWLPDSTHPAPVPTGANAQVAPLPNSRSDAASGSSEQSDNAEHHWQRHDGGQAGARRPATELAENTNGSRSPKLRPIGDASQSTSAPVSSGPVGGDLMSDVMQTDHAPSARSATGEAEAPAMVRPHTAHPSSATSPNHSSPDLSSVPAHTAHGSSPDAQRPQPSSHEEALRYLLHHLKEIRDKV